MTIVRWRPACWRISFCLKCGFIFNAAEACHARLICRFSQGGCKTKGRLHFQAAFCFLGVFGRWRVGVFSGLFIRFWKQSEWAHVPCEPGLMAIGPWGTCSASGREGCCPPAACARFRNAVCFALCLTATDPLKPCDRDVFEAFYLLLKKE